MNDEYAPRPDAPNAEVAHRTIQQSFRQTVDWLNNFDFNYFSDDDTDYLPAATGLLDALSELLCSDDAPQACRDFFDTLMHHTADLPYMLLSNLSTIDFRPDIFDFTSHDELADALDASLTKETN